MGGGTANWYHLMSKELYGYVPELIGLGEKKKDPPSS